MLLVTLNLIIHNNLSVFKDDPCGEHSINHKIALLTAYIDLCLQFGQHETFKKKKLVYHNEFILSSIFITLQELNPILDVCLSNCVNYTRLEDPQLSAPNSSSESFILLYLSGKIKTRFTQS